MNFLFLWSHSFFLLTQNEKKHQYAKGNGTTKIKKNIFIKSNFEKKIKEMLIAWWSCHSLWHHQKKGKIG